MQRTLTAWRRVAALVLFAALPLLCPRPAVADDTEQRVEHMVKRAMDDYDALEFNSAQRTLVDAITKLRSAGLDQTPLAAKTHMSLGIVYVAGLHDRGRGQQQFERALAIDPTIKLDPAVATPELQQTFDAALQSLPKRKRQQAQDGQQAQGTPSQGTQQPLMPPVKTEPNAPVLSPADALQHNPVEEAGAGQRVPVYAHPLVSIAKAVLFYRGLGQGGYSEAAMGRSKKVPGDIVGYIPHEATGGSTVQYYIEAFDLIGSVVGRQGSADSPFIISLAGGKAPPPPGDDREDPLAGMRQPSTEAPKSRLYLDLALGSGLAFIGSGTTTEVAYYYNRQVMQYQPAQASSGGSVWSGLGLRAEAGFYVWRGLTIGASLRFEPYLNHNADSAVNTASPMFPTTSKGQFGFAGLGKLRYEFRRHTMFHPYVHFDVGGGIWRGSLDLSGSMDPAHQLTDACSAIQGTAAGTAAGCQQSGKPGYNSGNTSTQLNLVCPMGGSCMDSVELGKFMIGAGGGFYVGGRHAGFTVDVNLIAAAGGAQFGMLIDVFAGPAFIF